MLEAVLARVGHGSTGFVVGLDGLIIVACALRLNDRR